VTAATLTMHLISCYQPKQHMKPNEDFHEFTKSQQVDILPKNVNISETDKLCKLTSKTYPTSPQLSLSLCNNIPKLHPHSKNYYPPYKSHL